MNLTALKNTGNGKLGGMFGKAKSTTPLVRENLSGNVTGITPEDVATSPNFQLVEGVLNGAVLVTPEMAANWLTRNKNIRSLEDATVLLYKENMLKGQWDFNGETVKFDKDGNMIDGQHRCTACVLSGKPFMTSVVYGVTSDINVDRGKIRKPDQIIKARGVSANPTIASAMISILHAYEDEGSRGFATVGHGRHPLTMEDRVAFAEKESANLNHSIVATDKTRKLFNKASLHAALHYIFADAVGRELADEFYSKLITGLDMNSNDPVYHLRERLLRAKREGGKQVTNINQYAGMIIKGWNYFITKRKIARFQFNYETDGVPAILTTSGNPSK